MWPSQLFCIEINAETWNQLLAVPFKSFEVLLIVVSFLSQLASSRGGKVCPLTIPTLGDHVDLLANLSLVDLLRIERVTDVEQACLSIHEGVYPETCIVGRDRDVYRQWNLGRFTNVADCLGLPLSLLIFIEQPDL